MRVGVISDIHGNLPALTAVASDMPPLDHLLCSGDIVGYNPWPSECIEWLRSRGIPCVQGNHDRAVASGQAENFNAMAQAGVEYADKVLSTGQREWLAGLPKQRTLFDGRVHVVHGHPCDPDRYTYPAEVSASLLGTEAFLIFGHTHIQHVDTFPEGTVVNPGSVGQPRDGDPRAAYAIIDLTTGDVALRRVEYDIDRVKAALQNAGLPPALGDRLSEGW